MTDNATWGYPRHAIRRIVCAWTELGAWHKGPAAPNGSVYGCMERHAVRVTVYMADYYGKGEHQYMDCEPMFQAVYDSAPRFVPGCSSDGNRDRIIARAARAGVTV